MQVDTSEIIIPEKCMTNVIDITDEIDTKDVQIPKNDNNEETSISYGTFQEKDGTDMKLLSATYLLTQYLLKL